MRIVTKVDKFNKYNDHWYILAYHSQNLGISTNLASKSINRIENDKGADVQTTTENRRQLKMGRKYEEESQRQ